MSDEDLTDIEYVSLAMTECKKHDCMSCAHKEISITHDPCVYCCHRLSECHYKEIEQ